MTDDFVGDVKLYEKVVADLKARGEEDLLPLVKDMFFPPPPPKPLTFDELFGALRKIYENMPPKVKRKLKLQEKWHQKRKEQTKQRAALKREIPAFERFIVELAVKRWVIQEYSICGLPVRELAEKVGLSAYKIRGLVRALGLKQAKPGIRCTHDLSLLSEWATKYPKWGTSLAELDLDRLLREHFPHQWRYVGDWRLAIDGKCPDFVHANRKLIIELFGEWPHLWLKQRGDPSLTKERAEQERTAHFSAHGYRTLVIWSKELRDEQQVVQRIREFVREADVTRPAD
jgi:very-short-patch-repair endonuclease